MRIWMFPTKSRNPNGGPLSRLLAESLIENKREAKIEVRLFDDTVSVWKSEETFLNFFEYLNTLHDSMKWTNEAEKDNKFAIFDIIIIRPKSGYSATVYGKPAASDIYIHYTSSHGKKNHQLLKSRTYKFCRDEEFLFIVNCVWGET